MNLLYRLILFYWYLISISQYDVRGEKAVWSNFVTSKYYANSRLVTENGRIFTPSYTSKVRSHISARMDCGVSCALNESCQAFNLYEIDDSYVCELLPDNLCSNETVRALVSQTGSFLWDKVSPGTQRSCFESHILGGGSSNGNGSSSGALEGSESSSGNGSSSGATSVTANTTVPLIPCQSLQPGCLGNWPNCTDCIQTCTDCYNRFHYSGLKSCMLWPDGFGPTSKPMAAFCIDNVHLLVRRRVTGSKGVYYLLDYRMPFENLNRISQLKRYPRLNFSFTAASMHEANYSAIYNHSLITANGTLMNLTLSSAPFLDFLTVGDASTRKHFPFVTVINDRYKCGSFWLLDSTNATYCPGGSIGAFGTATYDDKTLLSTGIRYSKQFDPTYFSTFELTLIP